MEKLYEISSDTFGGYRYYIDTLHSSEDAIQIVISNLTKLLMINNLTSLIDKLDKTSWHIHHHSGNIAFICDRCHQHEIGFMDI